MKDLIPVTQNENGELLVSARDLHEGLESKERFSKWFDRMLGYGFEENIDFKPYQKVQVQFEGSREVKRTVDDYALKIDMAKEICMLQRSDKGRQFRKYFIKIEKEYKNISTKDKYISEIDIAKAELSLVEVTAKLLNLNDSSKLALATNIYENHNIPTNLLPQYTKSKDRILPVSDLLKKNYINMSAIAFNKLLVEKGILKECTRKTSNGGNKKFKMLVDTEWGENLVNPKCPKETQPMYYQDKFCKLLKKVL